MDDSLKHFELGPPRIMLPQQKMLGVLSAYLTLIKGFIALGILYMPKYRYNGGWLFPCSP